VLWNVVTDPSTSIIRRYGGSSLLSEISVGDYISFNGPLDTTKATATVNAKTVKDWSIQKRHADFSGSITSVATSTSSFVLQTKERGALTAVAPSLVMVVLADVNTVSAPRSLVCKTKLDVDVATDVIDPLKSA
jgi:hypothetical protein